MKKIVFTFGRMNPPTIGHAKLVDKVQSVAKSEKADARVYLSHTQNAKKDPLDYNAKIRFAKKAFGNIVTQSNSKTVFQIMSEIQKDGYTDVIMVVGSDRVDEFKQLLNKYNGKDYEFDSISVVSAGERDPDATGVEGMSASKLRAVAKEGDFNTFKSGLPKGLTDRDAKAIFDTINKVIKEEIEEQRAPLTIAQRQAKARQMKRLAPKLARMRKMKAKRMANREQILKRAQKAARNVIRKKVAGERGADYSALSASEKITIDKLVAKKTAVIQKLAKKLLPKVRKAEMERLKQARTAKNEDFDILAEEVFALIEKDEREKEVAQDSDVKDMPGTQPKKYYKGLSDKEKEARAKQFARQAKKDDDDPSAYKAPASNKDAETKPSKHTKKYHQMFGEQDAVKAAQEKIKAEKEADKRKHDAMLDRARRADTQAKNAQTEEYELSEDSAAALKKKSEKSGIPVGILRQVYNRGMAAWKTGHRPGATQQQWAYARVNSFITGGKTRTTADADLWAKAKSAKKSKKEEVAVEDQGPCWDGYKQVGMKTGKGGKPVPNCVQEAVSPAQQAAIAISKKERGEKPKNEDEFKPHMMYDPKTGESKLAKVPADHVRLSKQGWTHEKPKKKKLNAMLGMPKARPTTQFGEEKETEDAGELKFGSYQTRHFDMCPAATALYKDMEVNDKTLRSVKLQDSLYQMEKEVVNQKSATKEDVVAAQNVADEIMAIAKMLDMEKEHGYIQGHVDKIKELATIEEMPRWLLEPLSKVTRRKGYEAAKKVLADVLARKKKEGGKKGLPHTVEYYAGQIARQFDGVDARVLADMVSEEPEQMDAPQIGTDKIKKRYADMTPGQISEQSEYQGRKVKLNDPFRLPAGSKKKFGVYVKNDKGNVVKVTFGDPNMEIKRDDPDRRKNFRARHNCDDPGPKWKARYWSCYQWRASAKVDN